MKKKRCDAFPFRECISKIIRVMKLIALFLLAGFMEVSANVYSQNANIYLSMHDVKLDAVIKAIQQQTEFTFFYSPDDVADVIISKIEMEKASLEKALDQCLKGTNIDYEVVHKAVILKKGKESGVEFPDVPAMQRASKKEISGSVRDGKGLPLPGVSVVIKGTTIGIITDTDGNFRLLIPSDAKIIVFSFIGMKTQEITILGKTTLTVVLVEETADVAEVVIVGYGIQKKESVIGAVSQIGNKALMRAGNSDVTNALAGKMAGVLTMQQSGEPGLSGSEIVIRGVSSWNGSQPLVLVDGVERDFKDLDPNEVATISVLKDASATAVFGAKGANGVIIVTTKRGNLGAPVVSFSAS